MGIAISITPEPNTKRVYLTATDARTRKSRGTTLYGVTPAQAIEFVREAVRRQASEDAARDQEAA